MGGGEVSETVIPVQYKVTVITGGSTCSGLHLAGFIILNEMCEAGGRNDFNHFATLKRRQNIVVMPIPNPWHGLNK